MKKYIFLTCLLTFTMFSCSKEPTLQSPPLNTVLAKSDVMRLQYRISTLKTVTPKTSNPSLSDSERVFSTPVGYTYDVDVTIDVDGHKNGQMVLVNNEPNYTSGTLGTEKAFKDAMPTRYTFANSNVTSYGKNGNVLNTEFADAPFIRLVGAVDNDIVDYQRLSNENFGHAMEALRQSDLFEVDESNSTYAKVSTTEVLNPEVSTEYLLSKESQCLVGYAHFDVEGKLISKTNLFFDENGAIIGHRFATPFAGPFSDSDMEISLRSSIENLVITY